MGKIIQGILTNPANIIASVSAVISSIALLITIINNIISHKHYIENLNPLLSFNLIEYNCYLCLAVKNTGRSPAKNIRITIKKLYNNGDKNEMILDDLFKNEFTLFPNEIVQGSIGIFGQNCFQTVFPYVKVDVNYIRENDKKKEKYSRIISFTRMYNNNISNNFKELEANLNSIAHSNNRIANYIEGRTLYVSDNLNVQPHNSLYKDMKDAFNDVNRNEEKNEINNNHK